MLAQSLSGFCETLFSKSRIFTYGYGQIGSVQRYGIGKMRLQYCFKLSFLLFPSLLDVLLLGKA